MTKHASNLDAELFATGSADRERDALMSEIPEFTPEQWAWIKAESRRYEPGYSPTSSLIEGL